MHYTSPHIIKFNERIWINGSDVTDSQLEKAHEKLLAVLPQLSLEKLTYFEYTTLLALYLSSSCDYLVLEAGLGGEFDATNVVENDLSLITTIGLDHTNFLGNTIEAIAKTKMRACDKSMIIGYQVEKNITQYAKEVSQNKEKAFLIQNANMDYDIGILDLQLPSYLQKNLKLAISTLEYLGFDIDLSKFEGVSFQGRCEKIAPNITIDVGHNPLAASELLKEFSSQNKKVQLIYNSFEDKDYVTVLEILKPIINEVEIIEVSDKRMTEVSTLTQVCDNLNIMSSSFKQINKDKNYLVFGSFLVVEAFLDFFNSKEIYEK